MHMRTYDISLTVSPDLPIWPGDPKILIQRIMKLENGDDANVSTIAMSVHTGTHVDAPLHFLSDGLAVNEILLKTLIGRAFVLDLPEVDIVTTDVLEKAELPPRTRRVLLKTRNSALWFNGVREFQKDYVALSPDGAQYLVDRGVQLVGVDYLSVAPYAETVKTHTILLEAGVVVVEGLDLSQVSDGRYNLYCLPIKLGGLEGAPARAILVGV
jgi:arylformamidase